MSVTLSNPGLYPGAAIDACTVGGQRVSTAIAGASSPVRSVASDFVLTSGNLAAAASLARTAQTLALSSGSAQTISGPVTHTGSLLTPGGLDYSTTYVWVGGVNNTQSNPPPAGIKGTQNHSGTTAVTIASATYNSTTGLVTLTTSAPLNVSGGPVTVSGATGTGSYASINGAHTLASGSGNTLTFTIATGLTMTVTGGRVNTGFYGSDLNGVLITDSVDAGGGTNGLNITHNVATGATGARQTLTATLNIGGTSNGTSGGEYSAANFYAYSNVNDGGSSGATCSALFGFNTSTQLGSSASYWRGLVGYELDVGNASTTVQNVYGLNVVYLSTHTAAGTQDNYAILLSAQGILPHPVATGLGFGGPHSWSPFGVGSTFIEAHAGNQGSLTVTNGISFDASVTFSGAVINVPGLSVPGQGQGPTNISNGLVVGGRTATIAAQGTLTLADAGGTLFMNVGGVISGGTITAGAAVTQSAYLPAAAPVSFEARIWDDSGNASATTPVVVTALDSATINGNTSATIATPFGFLDLVCNGHKAWRIG